MRVGYFGGSFDPPHLGHLQVALAARDRFRLDRVLLAPTGRQPLKPNGPTASFADRLHMTELLCAGHPGLEASSIDAPKPGGHPNYTVDTLRSLRHSLTPDSSAAAPPSDELFAIVGADAFATLPQWRDPEELLRLAQWIVVSRPGYSLPPLAQLGLIPSQIARVHTIQDLAIPMSATAGRSRLSQGQDCCDLIPAKVLAYIRTHRLYTRS